MGESFGANLVAHQRLSREGVLAIVRQEEDGSYTIIQWARGAGEGGFACLPVADLDRQQDHACYQLGGRIYAGEPVQIERGMQEAE